MPGTPRPDPYAVLGVSRRATPLAVARAHRRLAKRYHPDLHPGEEVADHMRRINDAWRLLSNPTSRAAYDLEHPVGSGSSGPHWGATRRPIQPAPPTTTRTWASWRASADETRAAQRTRRAPGEVPLPSTRRPARIEPAPRTFLDSGVAAVLVAAVIVLLLVAAVIAGKMA